MKFPYIINEKLSNKLYENWKVRFSVSSDGYNRAIRENIWRRHQTMQNRELSGWTNIEDARRRVVHFRDEYSLDSGNFVLKNPYLFLHLKLPKDEIENYIKRIKKSLKDGEWIESSRELFFRGDLELILDIYKQSEYDISRDIYTPSNYRYLDMTLKLRGVEVSKEIKDRVWVALDTGIREIIPRGEPKYIEPKDIIEFLPARVELGCGASIEASIPALNYLHGVYSIKDSSGNFTLNAKDDHLLEIIASPESKYKKITYMHSACLKAKPTNFYKKLKELVDSGDIIEPIITNNFDGIPLSVGIEELSLRKFDRDYRYPKIKFDKEVKSLIVIGSHADRREAQKSAREQGLQIIYVDPEGYDTGIGFNHYPLESPQNEDLVIKMKASDFISLIFYQ